MAYFAMRKRMVVALPGTPGSDAPRAVRGVRNEADLLALLCAIGNIVTRPTRLICPAFRYLLRRNSTYQTYLSRLSLFAAS